jgi:WD40 repeat protein
VESGISVRQPLVGHTDIIHALAFDPLGRFLASGSEDKSIWLWDLATDEQDGVPLERHLAGVTSLAFNSDASMLASGSADRSLILWDIDTHQPIGGQMIGATGTVLSLDFLHDNSRLISGASDGSLLSWDVSLTSWIERLCDLAGRNLTNTEWQQFISQDEYRKTCPQLP